MFQQKELSAGVNLWFKYLLATKDLNKRLVLLLVIINSPLNANQRFAGALLRLSDSETTKSSKS